MTDWTCLSRKSIRMNERLVRNSHMLPTSSAPGVHCPHPSPGPTLVRVAWATGSAVSGSACSWQYICAVDKNAFLKSHACGCARLYLMVTIGTPTTLGSISAPASHLPVTLRVIPGFAKLVCTEQINCVPASLRHKKTRTSL